MTVQKALDNFIRSRHLKGLSGKSVDSYINLISRFVKFIGVDTEMETITQEILEQFIDSLYSVALTRASIASYIRNTRIFLRWYEKKHTVNYSTKELVIPKTPKKVVRIYTAEEISMIFNAVNTCAHWLDARNRAIIALMLDSGLRQGEICSLKREDLYFDTSRIKVCGKGSKERLVPLGKMSCKLLKNYLELCPWESENVFVSFHGEPLTCGAVKSMTWDLQKKLPFEFSSHKLRHNFATNYLLNQYETFGQMDVYQLMTIMGHEDLATLRRYLHAANSILASRSCISHLDKLFLTAE